MILNLCTFFGTPGTSLRADPYFPMGLHAGYPVLAVNPLKTVLTIKLVLIKLRKLKVIVDNYGMHR